jgi:monomeric isocitrate dehydrogenase
MCSIVSNNLNRRKFILFYWILYLVIRYYSLPKFAPVAKALKENEEKIMEELLAVEGQPQDVGGYFHPNDELASKAMRPSATLNAIIDAI